MFSLDGREQAAGDSLWSTQAGALGARAAPRALAGGETGVAAARLGPRCRAPASATQGSGRLLRRT